MTTTEQEALNFINERLPNGGMPFSKTTSLTKVPSLTAHQLMKMLAEFREIPTLQMDDEFIHGKAYLTQRLIEINPRAAKKEIAQQMLWVRNQFKNK